jgi:hypothetical protein
MGAPSPPSVNRREENTVKISRSPALSVLARMNNLFSCEPFSSLGGSDTDVQPELQTPVDYVIPPSKKGKTNDWLTPPALVKQIGPFDLDPCGCKGMPWRIATTTFFLPEQDGLVEPWFGRVILNPPYGADIGPWLKRMADHGNGVLVVFARCETAAWQEYVFPHADAALFLAGRVHFRLPSGERGKSGTAPSMLLAFGQNNVDALHDAGITGAFYRKAEMIRGIKVSTF